MAGTLSVQTIQGLATAADPTTVSIASGHKLHAPGHVVQMKRVVVNTVTSTTSTTFVNHMSAQFDATPTVGNLVIVQGNVTAVRHSGGSPSANWASACTIWINSEGMASGNSDFAPVGATSSYAGYNNYGRQGMVGSYYGNNITTTGHKTITSSHISGGNPTFYFKVAELGGNTTNWGSGSPSTSGTYDTDLTSMILWEIAQ